MAVPQTTQNSSTDIASVVATLASRQGNRPKSKPMSGPKRAAILMLALEFVSRMSASGALMGNFDATERLLQQYLPKERVTGIMDEIRGPAGRNMWEKLSNVQEEVLANYLKNEYPQTIAVVLSKLKP